MSNMKHAACKQQLCYARSEQLTHLHTPTSAGQQPNIRLLPSLISVVHLPLIGLLQRNGWQARTLTQW